MLKKENTVNVEFIDRRKHWRDRRAGEDRRSPHRLQLVRYDCRSGQPRRQSDVGGKLTDGDVWWNKKDSKTE